MKAEKWLLVLLVSMLFASAALASFFSGGPHKLPLAWGSATVENGSDFSGALVLEISQGKATKATALRSFAPYECGETGQLCPDARDILQEIGAAKFVVQDGQRLVVASEIP